MDARLVPFEQKMEKTMNNLGEEFYDTEREND